ncbi:hypothetical protein [Streptomyces sp. NPDC050600]|uniref:hypothetical protein n=1 Tax=Streptomyces sp. NPDC050600 TaxID=3157213 RepID=UPI00342BE65D
MTRYPCGSCSYESNHLDDLRLHGKETGHALRVEDTAAPADAKVSARRFLNVRTAAEVVIAGTAAGLLWKCRGSTVRADRAAAMAAGLLTQLAEAAKEIDYLKSASGAGKTLVQYRRR